MRRVDFAEYQATKNEILFGKKFKEYTSLGENGHIMKEYCTKDGQNFYEINDNGRIEFWSTKQGESKIYEETTNKIKEIKEIKTEILGVDCYQMTENIFEIRLVNGQTIIVKKDIEYNGSIWNYQVNGYYFNNFKSVYEYVRTLIVEKLTGNRIIYHTKKQIPEICGYEGKACRHPEKCNTMLCLNCPIAEQFFAKHDNVKLIYVIS